MMKRLRTVPTLTVLIALSGACLAAGAADQASPPQGQTAVAPAAAPAPQGPPKVCLDLQSEDDLTKAFADRLREAIGASGALSLASASDSCNLRLHVPGNLVRFETAGGLMVSAVVIVTSPSDRYLSASISACQAKDLKPCAVRAASAAKLAMLVSNDDGT